MSETLTGRTRLRPAREQYGTDILVLQVEIDIPLAAKPDETWRDAKVEDMTVGAKVPTARQD